MLVWIEGKDGRLDEFILPRIRESKILEKHNLGTLFTYFIKCYINFSEY